MPCIDAREIIKEKVRHAVGIANVERNPSRHPLQQHRHIGQVEAELVAKVHAFSVCAMQLPRTCTATNTISTLVSISIIAAAAAVAVV
jgi:hypothetical protein